MISADRRWIFVHIQKTGGNAVRMALGVEIDDAYKHFFARELRDLYGDTDWRQSFKFSFVRNPWERLVSWWAMIDANRSALSDGRPLNNFHRFVLERTETFKDFLENCDEEIADSDGRKWVYRNQLDYLTNSSGKMIVDFVGRFETISQDFALIAQKINGRFVPLSHTNQSVHRHYTDYYTPALADKVASRYAADIKAFGYIFGR
jgi:chondroitin 4-sulfotransferase 11